MRQYQVPQFITIEDKVIGPFTLKQFGFLGAGAVIILLLRLILTLPFLIPIGGIIAGIALALAFLKIHEQPFPVIIRRAFFFFIRPKLYIWKKEQTAPQQISTEPQSKKETVITVVPKMSASRLSDLAWSLDIHQKFRNTNQESGTRN